LSTQYLRTTLASLKKHTLERKPRLKSFEFRYLDMARFDMVRILDFYLPQLEWGDKMGS